MKASHSPRRVITPTPAWCRIRCAERRLGDCEQRLTSRHRARACDGRERHARAGEPHWAVAPRRTRDAALEARWLCLCRFGPSRHPIQSTAAGVVREGAGLLFLAKNVPVPRRWGCIRFDVHHRRSAAPPSQRPFAAAQAYAALTALGRNRHAAVRQAPKPHRASQQPESPTSPLELGTATTDGARFAGADTSRLFAGPNSSRPCV